jgi:hypothetical protein
MMKEGKVYSINEEQWDTDFDTVLDELMIKEDAKNRQDLIGAQYFEGVSISVKTEEFFDIDMILDAINEDAYEKMGEYAEDYPDLTSEESRGWVVNFDNSDWVSPQCRSYDGELKKYRRARLLPDLSGIDESTICGFEVEE